MLIAQKDTLKTSISACTVKFPTFCQLSVCGNPTHVAVTRIIFNNIINMHTSKAPYTKLFFSDFFSNTSLTSGQFPDIPRRL